MRIIRVLLISLVCALAMLPARAVWAAVAVNIVEPMEGWWQDRPFHIRVEVSSTLQITRVLAEMGTSSVLLTNTGGTTYEGDLTTFGLPPGENVLTVTATDVEGDSASAQRTVRINVLPTLKILAPRHDTVAHPTLRIAAACADDPPEDCTIRVRADVGGRSSTEPPIEIARGGPTIDEVVDLSALDGKTFTLQFVVGDTVTSRSVQWSKVHVDGSPLLAAVDEAPGPILDFDASRILFIKAGREFAVLDRATRAISPILTVPYPHELNKDTRAFLTRAGAVMDVPGPSNNQGVRSAVYEWRDGALLRLAEHGRIAFVHGDYMAYSGNGTYLRDLETGTDEPVVSAVLDPLSFDVAENGLLAYVQNRTSLYTYMAGTSTLRVTSGDVISQPVTDGTNVVFTRELRAAQHQTLLATPSGQVPLGIAPAVRPEDPRIGAYQLHAGYIAFLRGTSGAEQVWLRTPTGEERQLSFFATASRLDDSPVRPGHDGISDTGEVMFLNGSRRYLAAPGAALRDISSNLGHARWFQGAWYVVMGNTLFKVDDGSAAAARASTSSF